MPTFLAVLLKALRSIIRSRVQLQLENLAFRHQICVLQRSIKKRPKLRSGDRLFWACLSRVLGLSPKSLGADPPLVSLQQCPRRLCTRSEQTSPRLGL
jgi:hypothetical protein